MNTLRTFLLTIFAAGIACAQDTPAPAPAAEPVQTEMQKWIATTDEQWQAVLKRDVTDVHLTELEKLKQQYVAALEAAVTKASSAGDLDGAVALRNEEKRFAGTNLLPEQDEATDATTVKQNRAAIRAQIAKLEKDTAARTKALHTKYDAVLADAQARLTKAQRLEDALLVKAKRDEVAKAWITPAVAASATAATAKHPSATPPAVAPVKTIAQAESPMASLNSQLRDTKWQLSDGKTFTLHADGTTASSWTPRKGKWEVSGPNSVDLVINNAGVMFSKATVNPGRTKITIHHDKGVKPETVTLIKP